MTLAGSMVPGVAAAVGGVVVLRLSWGRSARNSVLNLIGWGMLAIAAVLAWIEAGAWGTSIAALFAMGAALLALGFAAWRSPPARRTASNRRARMLPEGGEPLRIMQRIVTFLLVVVVAMVAAIAFAITVRRVALFMGASEANANVLALFATPLMWAMLAFVLLMTRKRTRQFALLSGVLVLALPATLAGAAP